MRNNGRVAVLGFFLVMAFALYYVYPDALLLDLVSEETTTEFKDPKCYPRENIEETETGFSASTEIWCEYEIENSADYYVDVWSPLQMFLFVVGVSGVIGVTVLFILWKLRIIGFVRNEDHA